jgi:hypothetical protein
MPSDRKGGRGRSEIYNWRVKCGNKEVFSNPVKFNCRNFIKENKDNKKEYPQKLRLIPPNY